MNTYKNLLRRIAFIVVMFVLQNATTVNAQQFHTLYWMQGIPQSSYANPALQPLPGFYLGIPALSAVYGGFTNTGFAPMDVLRKDANGKLYFDDENLISRLSGKNQLMFDVSADILAFGFRTRQKNYFSFNVTERVETRLGYPGDLVRLGLKGNDPFREEGVSANFGGFALDVSHFREFGLGFSRKWTDRLNAGFRAKLLLGMGNVSFARSNIELFTGPVNYELLVSADMLVNTSLPIQLAPLDELGDGLDVEFEPEDAVKYLLNSKNLGFAIDLGASYNITPKLVVAASIRDLGYINWNSDVENFALKGQFEFTGLSYQDVFPNEDENGGNENGDDPFKLILDSIIDLFDRQETTNAYSQMLTSKAFLSVAYNLTSMHKFALLGRGEFYAGKVYPSFTASYNFQPINRFGSTISYSYIHGNYHNLGFGFHINLLPLQIYVVGDNLFWALQPHTFQVLNIQAGVNLAFGYRKKKADPTAPSFRW
jgi:hypothetical protein